MGIYINEWRFNATCSLWRTGRLFNGNVNFGKSVNCTISRNGDLISQVYLKATLPETDFSNCPTPGEFAYCENFGFALIDNVTCEIGGTTIDKQYGEWMYIWDQLAGDRSNKRGLDAMIGNVPELTELSESKDRY